MNRTITIVAAALLLASSPVALANWGSYGQSEPDTEFDTALDLMWPDSDVTPASDGVRKVYFNAFPTAYLTGYNTNAQGSQFTPYTVHINAVLGVWKDCNDDGYIGYGDQAMTEYRAEILTNSEICPAGESEFNDGSWVTEFIHLGPIGWNSSAEANIINGTGIAMWGDLGKPGALPGFSCSLSPPTGTTSRTGGLLLWGDCSSGRAIVKGVNTASRELDPDNELGLYFGEPTEPQHSDSVLNQDLPVNLYGNPYNGQAGLLESGSGKPTFTTWDCNASPDQSVDDPTYGAGNNPANANDEDGLLHNYGDLQDPTETQELKDLEVTDEEGYITRGGNFSDEEGNVQRVYPVVGGVSSNPADSSVTDSADQAERGALDDCSSEGTTLSSIAGINLVETTLENEGLYKDEIGSNFTFNDGSDWSAQNVEGIFYGQAVDDVAGANTPRSFGISPGMQGTPRWSSTTIITSEEFYVSPESGPTHARYFTFYVQIPDDVRAANNLQLPGGVASRAYGSDNCPAIGQGAAPANGWNCDPTQWYMDSAGQPQDPDYHRIRVGAAYQLRDVDCFNGIGICGMHEDPFLGLE